LYVYTANTDLRAPYCWWRAVGIETTEARSRTEKHSRHQLYWRTLETSTPWLWPSNRIRRTAPSLLFLIIRGSNRYICSTKRCRQLHTKSAPGPATTGVGQRLRVPLQKACKSRGRPSSTWFKHFANCFFKAASLLWKDFNSLSKNGTSSETGLWLSRHKYRNRHGVFSGLEISTKTGSIQAKRKGLTSSLAASATNGAAPEPAAGSDAWNEESWGGRVVRVALVFACTRHSSCNRRARFLVETRRYAQRDAEGGTLNPTPPPANPSICFAIALFSKRDAKFPNRIHDRRDSTSQPQPRHHMSRRATRETGLASGGGVVTLSAASQTPLSTHLCRRPCRRWQTPCQPPWQPVLNTMQATGKAKWSKHGRHRRPGVQRYDTA